MRVSVLACSLLLLPCFAAAQEEGLALNVGRGLNNGGSVGWTFKENWTLQPTIGAGYSAQSGWQMAFGSTVLRSFGYGHRVYGYIGAGIYYGSANTGTYGRGGVTTVGGVNQPSSQVANSLYQTTNIGYVTAPVGLRVRVYGNVEAFAETAYQRTLSGEFGQSQAGQFSNNGRERVGATFGITYRLR